MTDDRYVITRGVGVASAGALALVLYELHRFAVPLDRCQMAAQAVWDLPRERLGWEVAQMMSGDYTAGFCTECGCGFKTFLFCERSECQWRPANFKPEVQWTSPIEAALQRQALGDPVTPPVLPPTGNWGPP